jgi:hypothetical protein
VNGLPSDWRGPVTLEAMAKRHLVNAQQLERDLTASGWHVDPWLVAWPPGEIDVYLRECPGRAAARDEVLNVRLRASRWPETTLYRDMLKKLSEGGA